MIQETEADGRVETRGVFDGETNSKQMFTFHNARHQEENQTSTPAWLVAGQHEGSPGRPSEEGIWTEP